jgi:hypothetical protein
MTGLVLMSEAAVPRTEPVAHNERPYLRSDDDPRVSSIAVCEANSLQPAATLARGRAQRQTERACRLGARLSLPHICTALPQIRSCVVSLLAETASPRRGGVGRNAQLLSRRQLLR